jgi:hypothetical protein
MKSRDLLTATSLVAIVLTSFHLADDVARGFEPGGLQNLFGIAILAVWLYGALVLAGRRSGHAILLLGSLLAAAIPVVHFSGRGVGGALAASPGGTFFIWTLFALGVTGTLGLLLATRGLWHIWRGRPND